MTQAPTKLVVVRNDHSYALMSSEIYSNELKKVALERGNHIYLVVIGPRVRVISVDEADQDWVVRTQFEDEGIWKPRTLRMPKQLLGDGELRQVKEHVVHRAASGTETKYTAITLTRLLIREGFASASGDEQRWYVQTMRKFFTYSVAYVGQAFGRNERRSAIDRLQDGHEHLQKILAEVHDYHPDRHVGVMIADHSISGAEIHGVVGRDSLEQLVAMSEDFFTGFGGALEDKKNSIDAVEALLVRHFQPAENTKLKDFPRRYLPSLIDKLRALHITHLGIDFDVSDSYAFLYDPKRKKASPTHRFSVNITTGEPEAAGNAPLSWRPN